MSINPFGYQRREAAGLERPVSHVDSPVAARGASDTFTDVGHQHRIRLQNYAALLCGGRLPITGIGNTFQGADLDGAAIQYKQIFKNTSGRILAVKVSVDFGISTGAVDFSFSTDLSGQSVVDFVTSSGRSVTEDILLGPDQILYAATHDPLIPLAGAVLRVLLLDPVSVFGDGILP